MSAYASIRQHTSAYGELMYLFSHAGNLVCVAHHEGLRASRHVAHHSIFASAVHQVLAIKIEKVVASSPTLIPVHIF